MSWAAPGKDSGALGGIPHPPLEPRASPNLFAHIPPFMSGGNFGEESALVLPLSLPPCSSDFLQTGALWGGTHTAKLLCPPGLSWSICNTETRRLLGSWLSQRKMHILFLSQDGYQRSSFVGEGEGTGSLQPETHGFSYSEPKAVDSHSYKVSFQVTETM